MFILIFCAAFGAAVSADNKLDNVAADVKLYSDGQVKLGDEFTVEIYIENITAANGIVANDLPLYYDRDRLSIVSVKCVFPAAWGNSGWGKTEFKKEEYPCYLRSFPEVESINDPAYWIKQSRQLGYKVTFKAEAAGGAFVAVENDAEAKFPILLVSIDGDEINNYGANGSRISVEITDGAVNSKDDESLEESASSEASEAESADVSEEPESSAADNTSEEESVPSEAPAESAVSVDSQEPSESSEGYGDLSDPASGSVDDGENGGKSHGRLWIVIAVIVAGIAVVGTVFGVNRGRRERLKEADDIYDARDDGPDGPSDAEPGDERDGKSDDEQENR